MRRIFFSIMLLFLSSAAAVSTFAQILEEYLYVTKINVNADNHLYINVKGNF